MKSKTATIPMRSVGPIKIIGNEVNDEVTVPLVTFETPLWPSTSRGARVTRSASGIKCVIVKELMSRSVALQADSAEGAVLAARQITEIQNELAALVSETSRFAKLQQINTEHVADILYLRFEFLTGDASGHNMVTIAAERITNEILTRFSELRYVSLSGNYCCDKKVSAVNGILGRGKHVIAETLIPAKLCFDLLKTTPKEIVELNIKKNLLGSSVAGGLRTANAHYANILLAFYLATGQDGANVVEGSQGFTYAELRGEDLYFSCTLPNIIVGTVGSGKEHSYVAENLAVLGCSEERAVGQNARRLAIIAAATVLCGELSLMAALCVPGSLTQTHSRLER